jgi:hypothetical protein
MAEEPPFRLPPNYTGTKVPAHLLPPVSLLTLNSNDAVEAIRNYQTILNEIALKRHMHSKLNTRHLETKRKLTANIEKQKKLLKPLKENPNVERHLFIKKPMTYLTPIRPTPSIESSLFPGLKTRRGRRMNRGVKGGATRRIVQYKGKKGKHVK